MLYGDSECEKTELVRAIAGEGVSVFSLGASEIKPLEKDSSEGMLHSFYRRVEAYRYGGFFRWLLNMPKHPFSLIVLGEINGIDEEGDVSGTTVLNSHDVSALNQLRELFDGDKKYNHVITMISINGKHIPASSLVLSEHVGVKIEVTKPTNDEKKKMLTAQLQQIGLKRSESFDTILQNSDISFDDITTQDCARHLPKHCGIILSSKKARDKTDSDCSIVGTKVFGEALRWIDKKKDLF